MISFAPSAAPARMIFRRRNNTLPVNTHTDRLTNGICNNQSSEFILSANDAKMKSQALNILFEELAVDCSTLR